MTIIHAIADIVGGTILVWLCVRELRRILAEPTERPIDTRIKRKRKP